MADEWNGSCVGPVHMRDIQFSIFVLIVPLPFVVGCSSSSASPGSQPCNENPWECTTGQTCWPKDESTFACLNSGPGQAGDACQDSVGFPTCGDGLACLETAAGGGTCSAYCDPTNPSHACPASQTCSIVTLVGGAAPQFQVCVSPSTTPTDAGSESSSSPFDAGGPTDAGVITGDGLVPAECVAWANHDVAQCPSDNPASTIAECTQGESLYPPEGCGAEWSAYVTCATQATYSSSCSNGPTTCDTQQNAYFACQSQFTGSTSCSRVPDQDAKCSASAPYGYGCLSMLPAGCVQLPPTGGATIACCPAFPAH